MTTVIASSRARDAHMRPEKASRADDKQAHDDQPGQNGDWAEAAGSQLEIMCGIRSPCNTPGSPGR